MDTTHVELTPEELYYLLLCVPLWADKYPAWKEVAVTVEEKLRAPLRRKK